MEKTKLPLELKNLRAKFWISLGFLPCFAATSFASEFNHGEWFDLAARVIIMVVLIYSILFCRKKTYDFIRVTYTLTVLFLAAVGIKLFWPVGYPVSLYILWYIALMIAGHYAFKYSYRKELFEGKIYQYGTQMAYKKFPKNRILIRLYWTIEVLQILAVIALWSSSYLRDLATDIIPGRSTLWILLLVGFIAMIPFIVLEVFLRNEEICS